MKAWISSVLSVLITALITIHLRDSLFPGLWWIYRLLLISILHLLVAVVLASQIWLLIEMFETMILKSEKKLPLKESSSVDKPKTDSCQIPKVYTGYKYQNNNNDPDSIFFRELFLNFGLSISLKLFRSYQLAKKDPMKELILHLSEKEKEIIRNKDIKL